MKFWFLIVVFFQLLTGVAGANGMKSTTEQCEEFLKQKLKGKESEKLQAILDHQWKAMMFEYPEWATSIGFPGQNQRWTDRSKAARENRKKLNLCFQRQWKSLNREKLNKEEQLTYDLALKKSNETVDSDRFPSDLLPLDQMTGIQVDAADTLSSAPPHQLSDFQDRLKRLKSLPLAVRQTIDTLKEGLETKVTQVQFLVEKVPAQIDEITPASIEQSPLYKAFLNMPNHIDGDSRQQVLAEAKQTLEKEVYPAFTELREFLTSTYIPKCRKEVGWNSLPQGSDWYASLVRYHTTTNKKPQEIHELGLKEVERISKEMEKVREKVKFKGDVADFHKFLMTDPQFFFSTPQALLAAYRDIAKRIDAELPRLFGRLPRLPYGVREMPAYKAPSAPTAYYYNGSLSGGRAGFFEANTYDLTSRPKWEMEVLTAHEAVPGHHLQIALAQEMGELPEFRKNEQYTAFVEGWGLYAESLSEELSLLQDPYSRYGQLSYEMWRAVRLVVDTGLHSKSWSKKKALDYFMNHVPKTKLQSENEIDRYISMPGQALAYKIGQMKFQELRAKAAKALGSKFSVRDFHDEVLRHGALPMDILESLFNEWLEQAKKK